MLRGSWNLGNYPVYGEAVADYYDKLFAWTQRCSQRVTVSDQPVRTCKPPPTFTMEAVRGIVLDLITEAVSSGRWQAPRCHLSQTKSSEFPSCSPSKQKHSTTSLLIHHPPEVRSTTNPNIVPTPSTQFNPDLANSLSNSDQMWG